MKLSEELQWRGFYNQATFLTPTELDERQYTLYLGTDPSGDSLHVGHLAVYMLVRRFIDHGHNVVLLVGGGTGVVGDPGGKNDERQLLSLDTIADNKAALAVQVSKLFSGKQFTLVDNYDWLKNVSILEFLRDVGKHFSMSQLVQRDFIATRIGEGGSGISYAEFSYTLLQGYDFWHLHNHYDVNLQIGGADQWGNILSGVELIRKKDSNTVYGMTAPLVINKATGRKFGKSEGGAVWLDDTKTSVYKFYQFWLNTDDESAIDYLKLFTLLGRDEIEAIAENHTINPGARSAQKKLAYEVTVLVHGRERTEGVMRVTEVLFGGADMGTLDQADIDALANEIPTAHIGVTILGALVDIGVTKSIGEARRLLAAGSVSIGGVKVFEDTQIDRVALIKKGKNTFLLVR
jgi:tyrosyl-tRNA synthetase